MNRTTARELIAPGTNVPHGQVLVATQLGDPVHGLLPCPAAPLVAGTLRRKGASAEAGPVTRCDEPGELADGAPVFVATCRLRDGSAAAIAAAAAPGDRVAAAAARAAVQEWSAVFATRRLISAAGPWCDGALRALDMVRKAIAERAAVYVYGTLAASDADVAGLTAADGCGVRVARRLADVPDGASIVFPAHGVPAGVRAEAAARGLEIIDATCPLVSALHSEARRLADRGDDLVLVGDPGHAVVPGIASQAPGRMAIAAGAASTGTLRVRDSRRVSYLLQPGIPVEETTAITSGLRSRFPGIRGPDPDGFCYAASDRAQALRAVASASDLMLVLGDAESPDARHVAGLARSCGPRVQILGEPAGLEAGLLAGVSTIGLARSTSAGPALPSQVIHALSGLGPLSIATRQVSTEVLGSPVQRP
jgi:4-hydroxy-3-methylbut-2-enyl diphosphate reductase